MAVPALKPSVKENTIYLVEDNPGVTEALLMLFHDVGWTVLTYASGIEFLGECSDDRAGCVVLDVRLRQGESGLRVQDELIRRKSTLPVIFITGHGDIRMAVETIKKGAINFLTKPFRNQELLESISDCLDSRADQLFREKLARTRQRYELLTKREKELLLHICDGHANKVIADRLSISVHTVEVHRSSILKKIGALTTAHLVSQVLRAGIVS